MVQFLLQIFIIFLFFVFFFIHISFFLLLSLIFSLFIYFSSPFASISLLYSFSRLNLHFFPFSILITSHTSSSTPLLTSHTFLLCHIHSFFSSFSLLIVHFFILLFPLLFSFSFFPLHFPPFIFLTLLFSLFFTYFSLPCITGIVIILRKSNFFI